MAGMGQTALNSSHGSIPMLTLPKSKRRSQIPPNNHLQLPLGSSSPAGSRLKGGRFPLPSPEMSAGHMWCFKSRQSPTLDSPARESLDWVEEPGKAGGDVGIHGGERDPGLDGSCVGGSRPRQHLVVLEQEDAVRVPVQIQSRFTVLQLLGGESRHPPKTALCLAWVQTE